MRTKVVQKAVVLGSDGKVLILRRSQTDTRRPLQWDLPGGVREDGEELIAGVVREITEETGLSVTQPEPIYARSEVREWEDKDGGHKDNVLFIFYIAETNGTDIALSFEHDQYDWVTLDEAIDRQEYYLQKELLEYIRDNQLL